MTKKTDPFKKLKYVGYCLAFTPPGDKMNYTDFIKFAKTFLCIETRTLFHDPVWDSYTDEELLVEYFARMFVKSEKSRQDFENELGVTESVYDDFLKFADKSIEKNQQELDAQSEQLENISYTPTPDIIGD